MLKQVQKRMHSLQKKRIEHQRCNDWDMIYKCDDQLEILKWVMKLIKKGENNV